jgi:hypothetical protein
MGSAQSSVINERSDAAELTPTSSSEAGSIESSHDADNWIPINSDENASEEEDEDEGKTINYQCRWIALLFTLIAYTEGYSVPTTKTWMWEKDSAF